MDRRISQAKSLIQRVITTGATKGEINRAYKYGMGLYRVSARVASRRIPKEIAKVMNLYIFSVDDDGYVKQWSPKDFGKDHSNEEFMKPDEN